jgi:Tfp pilus assembly protein PilX
MSTRAGRFSHGNYEIQTGMVLLLCLIFLMALTLLGLSASSDAILQNRLAGNLQESERAKQSALLTLSWAEKWLLALDGTPPEICTTRCDGLYLHAAADLPPNPESESFAWWIDQGHEAGINPLTGDRVATISSDSINKPVWIIEVLRTIPPADDVNPNLQVWYRILARGSGRTDTAVSVIESVVVRSWPAVEDTESPETDAPLSCYRLELPVKCGRYSWRELR